MNTYISPDEILLNILFALILVIGFGFILLLFKQSLSKWDVRIAVDDGLTIHYRKARLKGKIRKGDQVYYVLEYHDDKRVNEVLIPDSPGYLRFMRFWGGLRKYVVFRVDKSGQPLAWETNAPGIDIIKLEHLKTHEMIVNALRTRIVLSKYMLYVIIIIAIVLAFTGIITWKALERPIIVEIVSNTTRTSTPPLPQPPRV